MIDLFEGAKEFEGAKIERILFFMVRLNRQSRNGWEDEKCLRQEFWLLMMR